MVYVFIVKNLKDHITNSKYYETANLKIGGPYWLYRSPECKSSQVYIFNENLTAGLGRIF